NGLVIDLSKARALKSGASFLPNFSDGDSPLTRYYKTQVQRGENSFTLPVESFEAYSEAIKFQLFRAFNSCIS
ncbi:MAG: DUF1194 domain-containing protein, partial [Pseudomonadota bacterium]